MSAPIWLFTGPEIGEKKAAIDQIRETAVKNCGNLDSHSLYFPDSKMGDVISLLQNGSLFADARFIVLRNAEQIKKKEDIEQLALWVSGSENIKDAFLVLVSDETGIDKKVEALIPKDKKRIFWELFEDRKEQWINGFFRKNGYSIQQEAVSAILELVENNTDALRTACSLFLLFFPAGYCITENDVDSILTHNREESPFSLFDALTGGDLEVSLEILRKLSLSKEFAPVQVIAGLTYCFRRLSEWHGLAVSGGTDEFSLKKAGFTSKKAISQYRKAAVRWDAETAGRILALLAKTDGDIRKNGSAFQDLQMELCLYAILEKNGKKPAVADYG
ncbi:DNA polymerase III subunit delta [Brucepastera parasyntrophica]|uniref:DNA polymerase III subunit delta n=1 Tax=Brucepastera parasyntrophica TaxID=2880008 RepID=UPI00210D9A5C|nr:DNA polymerase III subunit delta [Brucepastera parasyntrophica]ULQ59376.1 DNA polymerase III subunit delta [Brucepastera parasyntrophica]